MNDTHDILKIVFLGESKCGKTSLILSFVKGTVPNKHKPTLFENYMKEITVDNTRFNLHICDTSGLSDFYRLRRMSYLNTDAFVICVDYTQYNAFERTEKWIEEVKKSNIPAFLCMTKKDCEKVHDDDKIQKFAEKHRLQGILECSCNDKKSLKRVFEHAVRSAIDDSLKEEDKFCYCCTIKK